MDDVTPEQRAPTAARGAPGRRILRQRRIAALKQRPDDGHRADFCTRPLEEIEQEDRRRLRRMEKEAAKFQLRIKRAVEAGEMHRARGLQRKFLASFPMKMVAVKQAARGRRDITGEDVAGAVANFMRISPQTIDEPIKVVVQQKPSGGSRPICSYALEDKARQIQARMALEPFVELRPEQFGVAGKDRGRNGAIRALHAHLGERNRQGYVYRYVMTLDICSFYGSVLASALPEFLRHKLPQGVIRNVVTNLHRSDDIRIAAKGNDHIGIALTPDHRSTLDGALTRLPQGSACSSLVAATVVEEALRQTSLPIGARLLNYADNICIVGKTMRDLEVTHLSLCSVLRRSPVGELEVRREAAEKISDGFDWLGYRIERRRGAIKIRVTDENVEKFRSELRERLAALTAAHGHPRQVARLRKRFVQYVMGWASSHTIKDRNFVLAEAGSIAMAICLELLV